MDSTSLPAPHADLALLSKKELHALADGLILRDHWAIDRCVDFVVAETQGVWHGRARAMMCRRLKHCILGRKQRSQLVEAISRRLSAGSFSEQFKDQLRLAMQLDFNATAVAARQALNRDKPHVVRYAHWVLAHGNREASG